MILISSPFLSDSRLQVNLYFQQYFSIGNKKIEVMFSNLRETSQRLCQCLAQIYLYMYFFSWIFISVAAILVISQWLNDC